MFEGNPVVYSLIGTMQTGAVILANLLHLFFVYLNRVVQWRMPASSFSLTSSNLGQARKAPATQMLLLAPRQCGPSPPGSRRDSQGFGVGLSDDSLGL